MAAGREGSDGMLRVGLAGSIYFKFYCSKKLATPLAFAESQLGVEEGSPSVRRHLLAAQDRQEIRKGLMCRSSLRSSVRVPPLAVIGDW